MTGHIITMLPCRAIRCDHGTYDHHAELVRVEDAHGEASRLIRDEAGRIVETISPGGATTRFSYDDAGRLAAVVTPREASPWASSTRTNSA
jgi:YD repeat-containing protein